MKTFIIFCGLILGLVQSHLAFAKPVLLGTGALHPYEESRPIDVSNAEKVIVGISTGEVICEHNKLQPARHKAILKSFFQLGTTWYEQKTCYSNNASFCSIETQQGNTISFKPNGSVIKLAVEPMHFNDAGQTCEGAIYYEVWSQ